jgi:hypothetical protein
MINNFYFLFHSIAIICGQIIYLYKNLFYEETTGIVTVVNEFQRILLDLHISIFYGLFYDSNLWF